MASPTTPPPERDPSLPRTVPKVAYWRQNLLVIGVLLLIWAVVSFGCSVLWIEQLNQYKIGNLPLGFWFAQQGAMYVFIVLILVYALVMDYLDRKHDVKE